MVSASQETARRDEVDGLHAHDGRDVGSRLRAFPRRVPHRPSISHIARGTVVFSGTLCPIVAWCLAKHKRSSLQCACRGPRRPADGSGTTVLRQFDNNLVPLLSELPVRVGEKIGLLTPSSGDGAEGARVGRRGNTGRRLVPASGATLTHDSEWHFLRSSLSLEFCLPCP